MQSARGVIDTGPESRDISALDSKEEHDRTGIGQEDRQFRRVC